MAGTKEVTVTVPAADLARYRDETPSKDERAYSIARRLLDEGVMLWEPWTVTKSPEGDLVVSGTGRA